ncbi:hypothetical protein CORT_0E03890 [Candida orthopsilosis Co 90-125]|uniref:Uncharacterized protein n=1 Tax=Candida orthopsilosis (strain 90-125) TaxID=1136231 RepID=H8X748_CANO9|nr:hypothetical protein CORT_0E03890 [Candida orthopsilosis Co 90-125]CCG23976.1 hypothetical protein CORT_0E03890 [Candida orthopsilosis Co 90-125]
MKTIMLPLAILSLLVRVSHQWVVDEEMEGGYPKQPAAESSRFDPYSNVTPLSVQSSSTTINSTYSSITQTESLSSTSRGDAQHIIVPVFAYYVVHLML